ncbi:MAG TPA: AsmA family protein [Nitratidesulfovibrio sp.]|nr:AsmA family protein [Nitratidesulfovibrio sp.]
MRLRPLLIILCIVLLAAGGSYVALRRLVDSEAAARQLGEALTGLTGHESRVTGGVRVVFAPDPTVVARDVVMAQAAPFDMREPLLRVSEARFNLRLMPLFSGRVEVRGVEMDRPRVVLLCDGQGRSGWDGLPDRLFDRLRARATGSEPAAPNPKAPENAAPLSPPGNGADTGAGAGRSTDPIPPTGGVVPSRSPALPVSPASPASPAQPVPTIPPVLPVSPVPADTPERVPAANEPRLQSSPATTWFSPQVVLTGKATLRIDNADLEWRNLATGAMARIHGVDVVLVARNGRLAEAALRHGLLEWQAAQDKRPASLRDLEASFTTPGGGWTAVRDALQGALDVMPHRKDAGGDADGSGGGVSGAGNDAGQGNTAGRNAATGHITAKGGAGALRMSCTYDLAPGVTGSVAVEAAVSPDLRGGAPEPASGLLPVAVRGTARARGHVPLGGQPVPFELSVPFDVEQGADPRVTGARLQLEQDVVEVTASLTGLDLWGAAGAPHAPDARLSLHPPDAPVAPIVPVAPVASVAPVAPVAGVALRGTAEVRRLSLPRWFGFARNLPVGLQHALDALSGHLEFVLDRHGLRVPVLKAEVLGMPLHGSGGVADFGAPVIAIDVAGADIDVNRVMPELAGADPHPLVHSGPPAVEVDDGSAATGRAPASNAAKGAIPAADDLPDVGYDIRVRAEKARGWKFDVGGLAFRCSPSREGTLLEFTAASFYGGTAKALLDIVDDYRLQFSATDVALARPAVIVSGRESVAGKLALKASVRGQGHTLGAVVASMRGTLDARIDDGFLLVWRNGALERQPFARFDLRGEASGQGLPGGKTPARLAWTGAWRTAMRTPSGADWEATANGPLLFDTATGLPVAADRLPATLRLSLPPALTDLDRAVEARFTGPVRFDFDAGSLSSERLELESLGARGTLSLTATGMNKTPAWAGTLSARFPDPRATLRGLGLPEWKMGDNALRAAELSGDFRQSGDTFELSNAQLVLDGQPVSGTVARISSQRPLWRFSLHADAFDADRYFAPRQPEPAPGEPDPPPSNEPLRYAWLRSFDADGRVSLGRCLFKQLRFDGFTAPILLRGGQLEVGPIASGFYGGTLGGSIRATAGDSLATRFVLDARDFDLEPVGLRFSGKDYVGGKAMLVLDVQGPLRTETDMPAALSGTWAFEVRDGFYSTRGKSSTPEQSKTSFTEARASGYMRTGVLHNDDFTLRSLLLTMAGRGWVDIARKRIDYTTDVSLVRVPTFPIRFQGDLRKPETSVRQSGIVTGTLGNLGSTVFDLLGGVIGMPLRVLEGLQDAARGNGNGTTSNSQPPGQ